MGENIFGFDVEDLYKWIDNYPLTRQKRQICRDFSDAIPLAEILKHHYPKLVDLHNYTARNAVHQKLVNWQTLNRKVLSKIDISLSNNMMDQLSQSTPGCIEKVLFDVKSKLETKAVLDKPAEEVYFIEGLSSTISGSVIPIKQKDSKIILDHKVIPVETFTKMESDLGEKEEAINILKHKLQHLESLLAIKDERINDLTKQLQVSNESSSKFSLMKTPNFLHNLF